MSRVQLPRPALMLVTDRHAVAEGALVHVVTEAIEGGVNLVQLREKDLPTAELFELGTELQRVIAGRALLIVNDRADVADALDADGVQLPENGLSVEAARKVLGPDKLIGRSVHSEEGAKVAAAKGADYLILGSVFPSPSHPDEPALGWDILQCLVAGLREDTQEAAPVPVLAIGGIDAARAVQVMGAGAAGVAVITAILKAEDPRYAAQALWAALSR